MKHLLGRHRFFKYVCLYTNSHIIACYETGESNFYCVQKFQTQTMSIYCLYKLGYNIKMGIIKCGLPLSYNTRLEN